MARSLTISHNETPATSSLFNTFFILAVAWMAFAAFTSSQADAETTPVKVFETP